MVAVTKNSKTIKITILSRTLVLIDIKMKKSVAELGHNGGLKIYVTLKKFTSTHAFKSISPKWLDIFG